MTQQRRVILEILRGLKTHPTADEVYALVRQRLPHVSLGTVYRNLDLLFRNGLALKLDHTSSQTRFDGDTSHHWHIRCGECGQIDDVFGGATEIETRHVSQETGFKVTGYVLEFQGVCPVCQNKERAGAPAPARLYLPEN